ncbi:MAG: hypothetical protein AB7I49_13225 [Candidatus Nitrosocosmicus sp.]
MLVNLAPLFQRIPQTFSCFCFPPSNYQAGSMIEFIVRHRWLTYDMTVALLPFYLMSKLLRVIAQQIKVVYFVQQSI